MDVPDGPRVQAAELLRPWQSKDSPSAQAFLTRMHNDHNKTNDKDGQPMLARCPDCAGNGGCVLGIRAAFRIPKYFCRATGLSRTYIYGVTTVPKGEKAASVIAYDIREPGADRGVRIVNGPSFCQHVRSHQVRPGRPSKKTRRSPGKKKSKPTVTPDITAPVPAAELIAPPPPPPPPASDNGNLPPEDKR